MEDTKILGFPNQLATWVYLLIRASHNHYTYPGGVKVAPGQLVTSVAKISETCGISTSQARTALKNLELTERIAILTTSQWTLITINNWELYQMEEAGSQTDDKPIANRSQTDDKPIATSKHSNSNSKKRREPPPEALTLARRLGKAIKFADPKAKIPADLTGWAGDIDKLIRIDGRTPEEIHQILRWVFHDSDGWWVSNIRSGFKLRKQFDTLIAQRKREAERDSYAKGKKADEDQGRRRETNQRRDVISKEEKADPETVKSILGGFIKTLDSPGEGPENELESSKPDRKCGA
jgi:hypothetical protein